MMPAAQRFVFSIVEKHTIHCGLSGAYAVWLQKADLKFVGGQSPVPERTSRMMSLWGYGNDQVQWVGASKAELENLQEFLSQNASGPFVLDVDRALNLVNEALSTIKGE